MTSEAQILKLDQPAPVPVPATAPPGTSSEPPANPKPPPTGGHRRNGKVAKLPTELRNLINHLLDEGATYSAIMRELAQHGVSLNHENLSNWHEGGYQDYLWREELQGRQEAFTGLLAGTDPIKLPEAGLQLAATGACELLRDLCQLGNSASNDLAPDQFVRVANSLARLSRSILTLQLYRDTAAKAKTLELKRLETNRDFVETERTALLDKADDLFGFKSHHRLQAEPASKVGQASRQVSRLPKSSEVAPAAPDPSPLPTPPPASTSQSDQPAIETRNSKFKNPLIPSPIETRNSQFENPAGPSPQSDTTPTIAPPADQSAIKTQNSKIQNPQELCPDCHVPLPPLRPDGQRPQPACHACGARLHAPGTLFDHCQFCGAAQPVLPGNERPSSNCSRCGAVLPPPGQRFVTSCPACSHEIQNVTNLGTPVLDRCPECRAPLPFLEPVIPPSPIP